MPISEVRNISNLTVNIVTCGRPQAISRLLNSMKEFVEVDYKLVILDNTPAFNKDYEPKWLKRFDVDEYISIDKPISVAESNNIMIDKCKTKYLMHLDDDLYFNKPGIIKKELDLVENTDADIASCSWFDTEYGKHRPPSKIWQFGTVDGKPSLKRLPLEYETLKQFGFEVVDTKECLKSMVVDYKRVYGDGLRWDEDFKWKGDMAALFMDLYLKEIKIKVLMDDIVHDPKKCQWGSMKQRQIRGDLKDLFYQKYGIYPICNWDTYFNTTENRK